METPSPLHHVRRQGNREGGAIAPPAAIANAVNDALRPPWVETPCHRRSRRAGWSRLFWRARRGKIGRMKAAAFAYERPADLNAALALMAMRTAWPRSSQEASHLVPMLNLRLVEPDLIVIYQDFPKLKQAEGSSDELVVGACITHGDIEDGRIYPT